MTSVYINYPMPHFSIKRGVTVEARRKKRGTEQRVVYLDATSLPAFLGQCRQERVDFRCESGLNDLWIELDLGDQDAEEEAIREIQELLGARYRPLRDAEWRYPR